MITHIVNIEKTITKDYFEKNIYPWDIINNIDKIISNLDKSKFEEILPNVWIGNNVSIANTATIIGPCIIDDNTEIRPSAYIRGNVIIGKNCVIGNSTEIKSSILFDEVDVPHFNYVGNSILGYKAHLGAGVIISNLKSDKSNIKVTIDSITYNSNSRKFGAIVGDYVEVGCNSVLTPGTVIGSNTTIYPLTMIRGEIPNNKIVKNPFEIVDKYKKLIKEK